MDLTWEVSASGDMLLGEGPRWLAGEERLVWVDLIAGTILTNAHDGSMEEVWRSPTGETVSAVVPRTTGGVAVTSHRSVVLLDRNWVVQTTIDLPFAAGMRCSDASAGPDGALWIGMVRSEGATERGALWRLDPSGDARVVAPDIGFANGLAFSQDGGALHLVDSDAAVIYRYRVDSHGALTDCAETFVDLSDAPGIPDGLCIDDQDRLWVAFFGGGRIYRIDQGGAIDGVTMLPARDITSCSFGSVGCGRIFATTAIVELDESERSSSPAAGSVLTAQVETNSGPQWEFAA